MKKNIILILIILQSATTQAQTTLKHIKGAKSILIENTLTPNSIGLQTGITHWFNTRWSIDNKISYQIHKQPYTRTHTISIEEQISYNLLNINNRIYSDIQSSIEFGLDHHQSTIEDKEDNAAMIIASLGIKVRYYINHRWSIIGELNQYAGKSQTIKTQPEIKIGCSMMLHNLKKSVRKIG